uniref:Uncharacterized protein n=1 Tax=Rhizophora mucronata TaxID=61149 RepID=A0A2P2N5Q4_RHIMU
MHCRAINFCITPLSESLPPVFGILVAVLALTIIEVPITIQIYLYVLNDLFKLGNLVYLLFVI